MASEAATVHMGFSGSRGFTDRRVFDPQVDAALAMLGVADTRCVQGYSGGAIGSDTLAERWCLRETQRPIVHFYIEGLPEDDTRLAPEAFNALACARNKRIVAHGTDLLLAFPSRQANKGTAMTMALAIEAQRDMRVVWINGDAHLPYPLPQDDPYERAQVVVCGTLKHGGDDDEHTRRAVCRRIRAILETRGLLHERCTTTLVCASDEWAVLCTPLATQVAAIVPCDDTLTTQNLIAASETTHVVVFGDAALATTALAAKRHLDVSYAF